MNNLACVKGILKGSTALTDSELEKIIHDMRSRARSELKASGGTNAQGAAAKAAKQVADDMRLAAQIEKRNARANSILYYSLLGEIQRFGDPVGGLEAIIAGSNKTTDLARLSVDSLRQAYQGKYLGGLVHDLKQAGMLDYVSSRFLGIGKGPLDDKIAIELWELREGGSPGSTQSPEAKKIADIVHKYQEFSRKDQNALGAFIKPLPGFIVSQSHDMFRINAAGFDKWYATIRPLLDERTFEDLDFDLTATIMGSRTSAVDEAKIKGFLNKVYKELSTGDFYKADTDGSLIGFKGPANLAKKVSQSRKLHFKDAQSWITYNDNFGAGSLMEAVVGGLGRAAKSAALLERFGTNPRAMFDRIRNDLIQGNIGKGNTKRLSEGGFATRLMDVADGTVDIPADVSVARFGAAVRSFETITSLGGAVLSSLPDLATAAGELSFQGRNFFSALGDHVGNLLAQFGDGGMRKEAAELLGVGFDGIVGDVSARMTGADSSAAQVLQKTTHAFFKLNLLSGWTEMGERALSTIMGRDLARQRGKAHADLPIRTRMVLGLYGIGKNEWDLIAKHAAHDVRGLEILAPDKLRDMPLAEADKLVEWPLESIKIEAQRGLERMQKRAGQIETKVERLTETIGKTGELGQTVADLKAFSAYLKDLQKRDYETLKQNLEGSVRGMARDVAKFSREDARIVDQHRAKIKSAIDRLKTAKKAEPGVLSALNDAMTQLDDMTKAINDWPNRLDKELNRRRELAVQQLETKLRAYYTDRSAVGVLKGGIREKAYTTQGSQAGTPLGEAMRFVMQFKQYGISFVQKVLGRYAQEDRFWSIPGKAAQFWKMPQGEAQQFASFIVTMWGLGYLSLAAKDLAKGREPRDPRDPSTWGAAFVQGGGAGIYGDFLFAQSNRFGGSILETAAGPAIGDVADLADIFLKTRDYATGRSKDAPDVEAWNFLKGNTPFLNLFYTRAALDYMILYRIQEALNPGSLKRMERRLKDEQNQEFILPPSEAVN